MAKKLGPMTLVAEWYEINSNKRKGIVKGVYGDIKDALKQAIADGAEVRIMQHQQYMKKNDLK
ncbi:MAG: hypothetical protein ACE5KZ_06650 [Candidatus Scalinduaceae bacterium]